METINNAEQVREQVNNLDKATLCPLHFDFYGVMKEALGYKAVYNLNNNKYCCSVSDEYQVIQHSDFFNKVLDSFERLNIPIKVNVMQHKNKAYMDIIYLDDTQNLKLTNVGEEFHKGIRVINSYDKTTGVILSAKFERLACSNGMVIRGFNAIINNKHNALELIDFDKFLHNGLNKVFSSNEKLSQWIELCLTDSTEWKTALKIVSALFKDRKHKIAILKELGINTEITGKKGQQKETFTIADELSKKTRWEIYNAITSYCSHNPKLRISQESQFQRIGEKVLTTTLSQLPQIEVTI